MEELELHAALRQHLVQGTKDDVPHTRFHLPIDRAFVIQQEIKRRSQRGPGLVGVVMTAKYQSIETLHQRGLQRKLRRSIPLQPFAIVPLINHIKTVLRHHSIQKHASNVGDDKVAHDP